VIFDFDGLILDTETAELIAWQSIYDEHGQPLDMPYWLSLVGVGAEFVCERPAPRLSRLIGGTPSAAELSTEQHRRFEESMIGASARDGVVELIRSCKAEGIPIAVASSSGHEWVERFLAQLGFLGEFNAVVCREDAPLAKPAPDLYLEACRRLGVDPANAVALEDSINGIRAAKQAGMTAIAVPCPATASMDFREADGVLATLSGIGPNELRAMGR